MRLELAHQQVLVHGGEAEPPVLLGPVQADPALLSDLAAKRCQLTALVFDGNMPYQGLVDALRDRKELPSLAPDEAVVVHYGQEFFRTHRVSRGAFQSALEQLGRQGVVELGLIFGNYSMLAVLINAFDTDLPPDRTELLLPIS